MNDSVKGILAAVIASSIWGGMYVISKVVLTVIPPLTLVSIRMAVSAAAILLFYALIGREWRLPRAVWGRVVLMGVIGYMISISAQFIGTSLAGASLGSLITTAAPLRRARISWRTWRIDASSGTTARRSRLRMMSVTLSKRRRPRLPPG